MTSAQAYLKTGDCGVWVSVEGVGCVGVGAGWDYPLWGAGQHRSRCGVQLYSVVGQFSLVRAAISCC